jgi:hypothetical protein
MKSVNRQTLIAGVIFFLSLIPATQMDRTAALTLGIEAALCMAMVAIRGHRRDMVMAQWEAAMQVAVLRMAWSEDAEPIRVPATEVPQRVADLSAVQLAH